MHRLLMLLGIAAVAAGTSAVSLSDTPVALGAGSPAVLSILVMGDSYSAGNGGGSYYGASGCYRSAHNYAREFERKVEVAPFNQRAFVENIACSGAVTDDFFQADDKGRPRQLNAVNTGYDVIFLTIGGNDLHFADIVKYCLVAVARDGATCGQNLTRAENLVKDGTMRKRISSVLGAIQKKADPDAKIVLLGYPYLEGDPGYRLRSGHFGNTFIDVGKRVRALGDAGEKIQKEVVAQLNTGKPSKPFVSVSVQKLFAGPPSHELYAQKDNPNRWMVQPGLDGSWTVTRNTFYHPNPTGWEREARLLISDARVPKKLVAVKPKPPPPPPPPPPPSSGSGSVLDGLVVRAIKTERAFPFDTGYCTSRYDGTLFQSPANRRIETLRRSGSGSSAGDKWSLSVTLGKTNGVVEWISGVVSLETPDGREVITRFYSEPLASSPEHIGGSTGVCAPPPELAASSSGRTYAIHWHASVCTGGDCSNVTDRGTGCVAFADLGARVATTLQFGSCALGAFPAPKVNAAPSLRHLATRRSGDRVTFTVRVCDPDSAGGARLVVWHQPERASRLNSLVVNVAQKPGCHDYQFTIVIAIATTHSVLITFEDADRVSSNRLSLVVRV